MTIQVHPYDRDFVAHVRGGGGDAYGLPAERCLAGAGLSPCRHCLRYIPEGAPMLILAARPFPALQPYAETGPIFLCAGECAPFHGDGVPEILTGAPDYLLKGYSADHRIVYGPGRVVPVGELPAFAARLLEDPRIAYVDVRSARNNCFLARITERP
ncbi:DUF1203 domain-containing protein [Pseudodonghicola flavimaris]|uniref:DUF1203 domain-containing protein n=1 Tax=Pseudodonghicola flavimaris TaxID=3050036 RepID=A0ABT7EVA1_9RHOB|nr:DUF1203 domain-containing protein [Pseudodonghicola flavimaris]MDK3016260.1 DUF1203 domain-containing protein [Pseudodonghicola flavimaris]